MYCCYFGWAIMDLQRVRRHGTKPRFREGRFATTHRPAVGISCVAMMHKVKGQTHGACHWSGKHKRRRSSSILRAIFGPVPYDINLTFFRVQREHERPVKSQCSCFYCITMTESTLLGVKGKIDLSLMLNTEARIMATFNFVVP